MTIADVLTLLVKGWGLGDRDEITVVTGDDNDENGSDDEGDDYGDGDSDDDDLCDGDDDNVCHDDNGDGHFSAVESIFICKQGC